MKEEALIVKITEINKFKIIKDCIEKRITQKTAAECLNLSTRQVRRLTERVLKEGVKGIIHKTRGKPSIKKVPQELKTRIIDIAKTKYVGFKPTFLTEKLEKEGIKLSKETVRKILIEAELWQKRSHKQAHRDWRERKEHIGELVQLDASHHDWFEGRGEKCVLVGYIDDASNLVFLRFAKGETTDALIKTTLEYIDKFGCPVAFYVDKDSVYKTSRGEDSSTQFSRLMNEFGIKLIYANSPQAKGRIERLFKTLQDRLIKEMRINNISSIEEANRFLEKYYTKEHNQKFSVEAKSNYNMHKKPPKEIKIEKVFVKRSKRSIANDYTVRYKGRVFQIMDKQKCNVFKNHKIGVEESLDKSIRLNYGGNFLRFTEISDKHRASYSRQVWMPPGTHKKALVTVF